MSMPSPAMPRSRVVPSYEYRRTRWKNGAGWTREIHAEPAGGEDWDWRLSIAEVGADGPFSTFAGVDRELVLLSGEGMRLRFDDGATVDVLPPHGRHRFAGEVPVHGELVAGPTHDFNLMWRRDRFDADLWRRPVVGAMVVFAEPGSTWVVHLLAGHVRFADASGLPGLAMGDTAILQAGDTRLRHVLDGGGEALVIRLVPRAVASHPMLELAPREP
ncbi:HutD/Ves family protein [Cognatilysobacter lacus]|uniref:HutD family protein n=1 Tax=Cognatilysobacter lacus TaxID=1643323 RepID=A0A5D8ZAC6_9GAMM|nr:HutD family protein [Lysobacter lacus]TZF91580.1 HutD family protein [Lysobacter lacus]